MYKIPCCGELADIALLHFWFLHQYCSCSDSYFCRIFFIVGNHCQLWLIPIPHNYLFLTTVFSLSQPHCFFWVDQFQSKALHNYPIESLLFQSIVISSHKVLQYLDIQFLFHHCFTISASVCSLSYVWQGHLNFYTFNGGRAVLWYEWQIVIKLQKV